MQPPDRNDHDVAVTCFFDVTVEGENLPLGYFSTCDGLGVEIVYETYEEGGNNGTVWQLPTRVKYPNVKLTRPLCADTRQIAQWISKVTSGLGASSAQITARTVDGKAIAAWTLADVVPVRWTAPGFSVDGPKTGMEQLEIAHHGISGPGGGS